MTPRGTFVAFEGIDGCGKSTQARRVADVRGALCTFEPGDTPLGKSLRAVVLDAAMGIDAAAELLVMAADRAQHVAQVIEPALAAGRDVVCDRFSGSTLAYQGYGRGLDLESIRRVLTVATGGLEPDLTILLDCPVAVARSRRARRTTSSDRFESDDGFSERVRAGFVEMAQTSASWGVVDAEAPVATVTRAVDELIATALS
ncbi:MAG TPA: dTMP kinase [Acidimicrobiales bacterium]|nr:dTMP kinase [Acidimicrobiales bacterium]